MSRPSLLPRPDFVGESSTDFRPIQPATNLTDRRQPIIRSRANISSACLPCKQRKRKCLGGQPCPACASTGVACLYDEALDRRRKLHNDKTRAEFDFQRRLLDALLTGIKGDKLESIINLVRSDASIEDLARELGLSDVPGSFTLLDTSPRHARTESISSQASTSDRSPPQLPGPDSHESTVIDSRAHMDDNMHKIPNLAPIRLPTFKELDASIARSLG